MFISHRNKTSGTYYLIGCIIIITVICLILFTIQFLIRKLESFKGYSDISYPDLDTLVFAHENDSMHNIYIDIGCYNGETIEHFIHFFPESANYDIITFEPEPSNYELCRQTLQQEKYKKYSITILPFAVWIRNEQVFFQINRGRQSRINGNVVTGKFSYSFLTLIFSYLISK